MNHLLRYTSVIIMAVCLGFFSAAQPVVKPLKFSNGLQQKVENKAAAKQGELLGKILISGARYFRSITGKSMEAKSTKMDEHVTMHQELFFTNMEWPGNEDAMIQVNKTLYKNVPSYETYELRFVFYPDSKPDSARQMFRNIYESINGSIVLAGGGKAILVNQPFIPVAADGNNRLTGEIQFSQFYKETGINVKLQLISELNMFYTITLSFSKPRMHNSD